MGARGEIGPRGESDEGDGLSESTVPGRVHAGHAEKYWGIYELAELRSGTDAGGPVRRPLGDRSNSVTKYHAPDHVTYLFVSWSQRSSRKAVSRSCIG
mmetsp:Transcript_32903/g.75753  ORF Transcript_32903/g.75753 Transcript_32903/m.75753 type:complete len:98 (-) Transcript_32903:1056-1349(-)